MGRRDARAPRRITHPPVVTNSSGTLRGPETAVSWQTTGRLRSVGALALTMPPDLRYVEQHCDRAQRGVGVRRGVLHTPARLATMGVASTRLPDTLPPIS